MNRSMDEFERPNSEQLTDLHIYVVPPDLWRSNLHSAVNQIINEAVSAGFVRVLPETSVYQLRGELEQQLDFDVLPREYVFLKSVGRCLTRVRPKQEHQLKVKHFLPPQAYAPEIYVLEATPDLLSLPSGSSSSSQTWATPHRGNTTPRSDRSEFTGHRPIPPIRNGNSIAIQTNGPSAIDTSSQSPQTLKVHPTSPQRSKSPNFPRPPTPFRDSPNNNKNPPTTIQRHNNEATQTTPPHLRGTDDKFTQSSSDLHDDHDGDVNNPGSSRYEAVDVQTMRDSPAHNQNSGSPVTKHVAFRTPTPQYDPPSPRNDPPAEPDSPLPPLSATPPESPHQVSPPPLQGDERQEYLPPLSASPPPSPGPPHSTHGPNPTVSQRVPENHRSQVPNQSYHLTNGADNGVSEDRAPQRTREDQQTINDFLRKQKEDEEEQLRLEKYREREEQERLRQNLLELQQKKKDLEEQERRKRRDWEEEEKRRLAQEDEERKQRAANNSRNHERDGDRRREDNRKPERREDNRRADEKHDPRHYREPPVLENGHHSRNDSDGPSELSDLKDQLQRAKHERQDMEKQREELVKKAKQLQNKTQQRRNQVRDIWKKKYFEEKKKTSPLEEQCNKMRHELESLHRKIMSQMEGSKDPARRPGDSKPSQQSNLKIQATRLNHDIEDLQRRVENVKMKLTTEMKLRNQAQGELKALRAELTQKKINVTLTRSQGQQQPPALGNPQYNPPLVSPRS